MQRARQFLNVSAGTLLGLAVSFELVVGSGSSWAVTTVRVHDAPAAQACVRGLLAEQHADSRIDAAWTPDLEVRVTRPGGRWAATHQSVLEASRVAQSLLRNCPGIDAAQIDVEPPSGDGVLGFVQSPL